MSSISSVHLCICFGYRSQREKKKKKKKTFKTEEKNKLSGRFQKSAAVFYGLMMDSSVLSAELIFVQNVRKATFFLFFCFFEKECLLSKHGVYGTGSTRLSLSGHGVFSERLTQACLCAWWPPRSADCMRPQMTSETVGEPRQGFGGGAGRTNWNFSLSIKILSNESHQEAEARGNTASNFSYASMRNSPVRALQNKSSSFCLPKTKRHTSHALFLLIPIGSQSQSSPRQSKPQANPLCLPCPVSTSCPPLFYLYL